MQFDYTGNNPRFLEQGFLDLNGALAVEITSISAREAVLTHTFFTSANVFTTFSGIGFSANQNGIFTSGVITSIEFNGLDIIQGTISDIFWDAGDFQDAIFDIAETGDFSAIAALINSSGPITIDASEGLSGFDQELTWAGFLPELTVPITFIGSPFDDSVEGTIRNDTISTRGSTEDGDRIAGSLGNDTIIFDLPQDGTSPGYYLDYDAIASGLTFDINGVTNTGSASGAGFVDTYEDVNDALSNYLGIEGTNSGDTYNVRLAEDQVFSIIGGDGADTYSLTAEGALPILDFFFGDVSSGIDINLATGIIANDGFVNNETLTISGTPERLILLSTDLNDVVQDGEGDQLVRLYNGNDIFFADNLGDDSIDGGNGTDFVSFDNVEQGNMTITFNGPVATVVDRTDNGGSTSLLNVETIVSEGNVQFNLSQHEGIGVINALDLTALAELYIAYFNRAADALGLSFWATAFQNGFTLREIADLFFTQPETQSLYSGVSDGAFVQAVYNNVLGRDADDAGFQFWTGQLASGNVTESSFILELLAGARAPSGDPADVVFIQNKTDIGLYYAVVQGQNNLDEARTVMETFDGSLSSLNEALDASDDALEAALASNTELLMPVVGLFDVDVGNIV